MHRKIAFFLLLSAVSYFAFPQICFGSEARPETRALWVDAFHPGIRSAQEADQLVADAKRGHFNVLFVQVRRRGDSLYLKSVEPPLEDPAYDPSFDGLAYIIDAARKEGIEVHAWVNAMPIWRNQAAPTDARHIFNQHGVTASGDNNWLTAAPDGNPLFPVGYFLDPGHPAAAAHVASIYVNLVRNYKLDGIHFDYIRYPEIEGQAPARGSPVGYNAVSLARFRRQYHRSDTPALDDPQWTAWRRQQVTQLVRRVYLEAKEINPNIKVTAAVIAWGRPPASEKDFENVAPMQRIFQDWHGWLKEGILDIAAPMNYAREADPRVREWFNGWIAWEKQHKHGRQLVVGVGGYLNSPENVLAQVGRVRKAERGRYADGMSFFSYASMSRPLEPATPAVAAPAAVAPPTAATPAAIVPAATTPGTVAPAATTPATVVPAASTSAPAATEPPALIDRMSFLITAPAGATPAFAAAVEVPTAQWISHPVTGYVAGTVGGTPNAVDGVRVNVRRSGWFPFRGTRHTITDGNGFFGFTNLKPGRYQVWSNGGKKSTVEVTPGRVTRMELSAGGASQ